MAFRLVDKGFDVWINNSRGSKYSLEHKTIEVSKNPEQYYDFSFHEIGIYDLPAVTRFVSKITKTKTCKSVT